MHWAIKRIVRAMFTVFLVINLTFVLLRQLPGGPMSFLRSQLRGAGSTMSTEQINTIAQVYINVNPEESLLNQYVDYMSSFLMGDFGQSFWYNEPVAKILGNALPWTVFLFTVATVLTFVIGILLGALMGYLEGSRFDLGATVYSILGNSIPYYVFGILALFVLGYQMDLVPVTGRMDPNTTPGVNLPFIIGVLQHALLPIASLVLTGLGGWALSMRGNSIRILGEDYLRVARLRGLSDRHIATEYVGRNAILPLYTSLMITLGAIFGGSVVLEKIFVYRGLGYYLFRAVQTRDYSLMMGGFILITVAVIIGVLIAELTYGKLDPRIREGSAQHESY